MAFRADDAIENGYEMAVKQLTPYEATSKQRSHIRTTLAKISQECGPFVDGYPAWHPFMLETDPKNYAPMVPMQDGIFRNLDHSVYLANGILTCPYPHGVDQLIKSINSLRHPCADFTINKIDGIVLHAEGAVPLLIKCKWVNKFCEDGTVPSRTALGLLLEREIPHWKDTEFSPSWENMKGQILGYPHGARSSLFVNQQTGQILKMVWNQLVKAELWGKEH
ncbi:hypothetical protein DDT52_16460 [Brenneria roseae subsp. roseae]|uniref:hypothetical protein n=1 Tax=Brenneria roseae TaxID=1509241 RepID=UPI000D61D795|nr:hypothetical protein [Brenneria roseae]PWC17132.1 hypothetical protein DDT52_16460 [Brenneria roseae subsp. roseae]